MKTYLVLGIGGIKDGDRVTICNAYYTAIQRIAGTCADAHEHRKKTCQKNSSSHLFVPFAATQSKRKEKPLFVSLLRP